MSETTPFPEPTPSLLTQLWQARQVLELRLARELVHVGISLEQFCVVGELLCEPAGLSVDELAERLGFPRARIADTVEGLAATGLLLGEGRVRLHDDAEVDQGFDILDRLEALAFRDLSRPERAALSRSLSAVIAALSE